jgi:DNA gyrase/topoisomerase IV subunit A
MDQNLPRLYKDYGEYSNYRNFPLDIDGLKPVERRVLLSAFKIARDKFVKSRQVDAYTIGHYHPHGECYGTIVQMVRQGFLIGQGNFGTSVGVEPVGPAAPRYTECRSAKKTIDMAFKYIDHVPWVDSELGDKEPIFLPTMYPICLLGRDYTQGIGFGFKTYIPCYDQRDLQQRLLWLLGLRKRKPIIAPITNCNIVSPPEDVDKLLTTGKAKISVEGVIIEEPRTNTVTLKSWPPGKKFESLLRRFSKELEAGMIGFTDVSVTETEIKFQVLRERNRDKIYKEFVETLKNAVRGDISFEIILTDGDQKVITKSVDQMLQDTYSMFKTANLTMLSDKISKIDEVILEYNLLEIIRAPLSYCIGQQMDIDDTMEEIERATVLTDTTAARELIKKYRIQKLLTLSTDTSELQAKKDELSDHIQKIEDFVLEQYNVLR